VSDDSTAGAGLFVGTTRYYARFRPHYPRALLDVVVHRFRLDGSGRLLDLGCGTGEANVPLADFVKEAVAFDAGVEMIAEARRRSERENVTMSPMFGGW
jgi:predicted TPR repeat methyltransferase